MANNNPQAIAFTQTYARGAANAAYSLYLTAKKFELEWAALNMQAVIPSDSEVISDGNSLVPVTDTQIQILQANLQSIVNTFEASSNLILNQVIAVATAGAPSI